MFKAETGRKLTKTQKFIINTIYLLRNYIVYFIIGCIYAIETILVALGALYLLGLYHIK